MPYRLPLIILLAAANLSSIVLYAADKDEYDYEFELEGGITVFGEKLPQDPVEEKIINSLHENGQNFIKEDLLINAGFRKTANVKFRKTTGSEKAVSVLHGVVHAFSFGIVPMKTFVETEYDPLSHGNIYSFNEVINESQYKNVSLEIRTAMELEYMLQIEFCNGIVIQNQNLKYYSQENIEKFEKLALSLPDYPHGIKQLKERYLNEALPKIIRAWDRYKNPSEDNVRALNNLNAYLKNKK